MEHFINKLNRCITHLRRASFNQYTYHTPAERSMPFTNHARAILRQI